MFRQNATKIIAQHQTKTRAIYFSFYGALRDKPCSPGFQSVTQVAADLSSHDYPSADADTNTTEVLQLVSGAQEVC